MILILTLTQIFFYAGTIIWLHATSGVWPNSSEQLTYLSGFQNSGCSSLVLSLNKLFRNNWLKIKIFYRTIHSFLAYMAKVKTNLFGVCRFCHLIWLCSSKPHFLFLGSSPSSQVHVGEAKSQSLQLAASMPLAPPDMLGHHCYWHWQHTVASWTLGAPGATNVVHCPAPTLADLSVISTSFWLFISLAPKLYPEDWLSLAHVPMS